MAGDLLAPKPNEEAASRDPWSKLAARPDALLVRALAQARSIAAGPAIQIRCLECGDEAAVPARDVGFVEALLVRIGLR